MGLSRQESWSGVPCPPPKDLPDLEIEPTSLASPALAVIGGAWEGRVHAKGEEKSRQVDLKGTMEKYNCFLEKGMATHSSILAWRIPWTEESLVGYSRWGCKEPDTTKKVTHNCFTILY
ncbi:unnamed protein product [Rangifer tarandus platyrhynchus]|uniref:Uncharacterized protein n=2 Tax=Rangifer tarandus platyrhynchus TaxID=3082113 RepID=A0ABN9A0I1_RANTA|nr:unnamed protein product [Rangifer tarandus platyrhynchus]